MESRDTLRATCILLTQNKTCTELDLSNNLIEDLCPEIEHLTALINLQLTGNKLQHVTPGIRGLTNLTKLSLDLNRIKDLPEVLCSNVLAFRSFCLHNEFQIFIMCFDLARNRK